MKKAFKYILPSVMAMIALLSISFAGCSGDNGATDNEPDSGIVSTDNGSTENKSDSGIISYISTDTEVFSTTAETVEAVADTVVEIRTESVTTQWGQQYIVSGAGSGVIVGQRENTYYIVTNNHVIDGAREISVTTRSGVSYPAELVATDDSADIAVITVVSESSLKIAIWGDSDKLKIGEDLIAIGNPMGSLGGTVTKGILSAKGRSITVGDFAMTLLQTDTAINPGNSGGGLFNMRGELIGVVNAKTTDEEIEGICFAIPANTARAVFSDLTEYGYIKGRATLNLTLGTVSSGSQTIVYLMSAKDPAENTFMQYDWIYSINGVKINSILGYNMAMSRLTAGDSVEVVVYRGKATQSFFGGISLNFSSEPTAFTVKSVQYGK